MLPPPYFVGESKSQTSPESRRETPLPPWEVPQVTLRRRVTKRLLWPFFANNPPPLSVSRARCIWSSREFCPVGSVTLTSQVRKGVRRGCGYLLKVTQLVGGRAGTQTAVSLVSEFPSPLLSLPDSVGYKNRLECRLLPCQARGSRFCRKSFSQHGPRGPSPRWGRHVRCGGPDSCVYRNPTEVTVLYVIGTFTDTSSRLHSELDPPCPLTVFLLVLGQLTPVPRGSLSR